MGSVTESAVVEPPTLHLTAQPEEQISLLASSNKACWRTATTETLRQMLDFAQYSPQAREQCLALHSRLVCPNMGPAPDLEATAKGCLTSDSTPIEYSFSFGGSEDRPVVRYSIDPDGTSGLGAFSASNVRAIADSLRAMRGVDMSWYDIIRDSMRLETANEPAFGALVRQAGHTSQVMFGFDFEHGDGVNAKAYFLPCLTAAERQITRWKVVREAVEKIANVTGVSMATIMPQLNMLQEHLRSYGHFMEENVRYLATDLIQPEEARLKIYIRCPSAEFEQVWSFMTMHGKVPYSEEHRSAIKMLYEATVENRGCSSITTDAFQKQSICYFVLKQGAEVPSSKLFIRMGSKGAGSDVEIARTVREWRPPTGDPDIIYEESLRSAFSRHDLDADVAAHAWLAVSVKKGRLTLESYLVPKLEA